MFNNLQCVRRVGPVTASDTMFMFLRSATVHTSPVYPWIVNHSKVWMAKFICVRSMVFRITCTLEKNGNFMRALMYSGVMAPAIFMSSPLV